MKTTSLLTILSIISLLVPGCLSRKETLVKQASVIPKDTSFTIQHTFINEQKKYPFIQIANPPAAPGVVIKENIVYHSIGMRKLYADIFYPAGKMKNAYPAVLLIHGGGWKSGDKSQNAAMCKELANHGYVAVSAEYRLSPEAKYPAALHDLKAAIKWMRASASVLHIHKEKIAVLGVSAGGQLAALLGATNGMYQFEGESEHKQQFSAVQAVINIDGILAFKHPQSSEGQVAAKWLGGTYEQIPKVWENASALTHAGKQVPPTLFIASQYPRFNAGRDDFIKKIQPFNIYTEVHTIPDTPHPFWLFDPWFKPVMVYTLQFLNRTL